MSCEKKPKTWAEIQKAIWCYGVLLLLPFKFFASDVCHWDRDQLMWLAKAHRIFMAGLVVTTSCLIGISMLAVQAPYDRIEQLDRRMERQREEMKEAIDKGDVRIDLVKQQVNDINIQVTKIVASVDSLTTNLVWGLRILGGMGLILMAQFATYVFGVKMRRELRHLEKSQE